MGKLTRRGAAFGAAVLAGALAFAPGAMAAGDPANTHDPVAPTADPQASQDQLPKLFRFAGKDRIGTAVEAAVRTNGIWAGDVAIVATADDFPDALAAAPLADALRAPILLSHSNQKNAPLTNSQLDHRVIEYLHKAGFKKVILVGGTQIFGSGVVADLEAGAKYWEHGTKQADKTSANLKTAAPFVVERIEGANRYQTAIELGIKTSAVTGKFATNVFLADGTNFPDALAAGSAAAANSGVVLLTKGAEGLDSKTFEAVSLKTSQFYSNVIGNQHASLVAVGGPATDGAAAGWQSDPVELNDSIVGKHRYQTAVMLAEKYNPGAQNFVVATGEAFPDGVVAGGYAANVDGPLILTKDDVMPKVSIDFLKAKKAKMMDDHVKQVANPYIMKNIMVFGGEGSVSLDVTHQIDREVVQRY